MSYSNYSYSSMKVSKFIITQTGTYQDQWYRPYQSQLDGFQQNAIIEAASQARTINTNMLAPMMSSFLTPSVAPESKIIIPQGFQTQRFRYVLEIELRDHIGSVTVLHVSGWTDHMGISLQSKQLDPDMRFFINQITRSRRIETQTPMGWRSRTDLVGSDHIIPGATNYTGMGTSDKSFLMRPEDVLSQVDNLNLRKGIDNDAFVYDGRTIMTHATRKSDRVNASATDYTAKILDGYFQASRQEDDQSMSHMLEKARGQVMSEPAQNDPFIAWLIQNSSSANRGESFTLRELLAFDEGALDDRVFSGPDINLSMPLQNVLVAGDSASWDSQNAETIWATTIAQSVPAYMAKAGLTKVHFTVTNDTLGANLSWELMDIYSLTSGPGADLRQNWDSFRYQVEGSVLRSLSVANNICYSLNIRCDLFGDTQVDVSLNGKMTHEYVWPTFTDAQNAPIVTRNEKRLDALAMDFSSLMDDVVDAARHNVKHGITGGTGGWSGGNAPANQGMLNVGAGDFTPRV